MEQTNLWGEVIQIPDTKHELKKIQKKTSLPKKVTQVTTKKSGENIFDKLSYIANQVQRILGVYTENTQVIRDRKAFKDFIDTAIKNKVIAIDTETNNSLDPITCKIMGLCLYTPGQKNTYIPINHVDPQTSIRLSDQLTEQDVFEELSRLPKDCLRIAHNGKFDYQVLKCTCNYAPKWDWDTLIAERLLDENQRSYSLKTLYIEKIDNSIEKYSIEGLFEDIPYELVSPEIFALYAATDSFMTYKLFQYQKPIFEMEENRMLYNLFRTVEMPIVEVSAEMELTGIELDANYSNALSVKYHNKIDIIDKEIENELIKYSDKVRQWRDTSEAQVKPSKKKPDGSISFGKSKSEQLEDPIKISSPTQLAILLYYVLKINPPDPKQPRGTGEDILTKIKLPLCELILKKRGLDKLINTYIDKLIKRVNVKDNRLHANFNQLGTDTGRFSSNDPNLQNIPSHNKEIRLMFKACKKEENVDIHNNIVSLSIYREVETPQGWVSVNDIKIGDQIALSDDTFTSVINIEKVKDLVTIYV